MNEVALTVNGKTYGGWKSVRVARGIEVGAGAFELSVTDRWDDDRQPWPIVQEDACQVSVSGVPLITGYVDKVGLAIGASEHSFSVSGRDKVGDLVDSSALLDKWEYKSFGILQFATKVAEPYGVKVSLQSGLVPGTPADKLTVDPGERAFETIEKACRLFGLLPISDGKGGLLLTRAGTGRTTTSIVEGQNLLSGSSEFDAVGRFRTYLVVGQHSAKKNRKLGVQIKGSATDENVHRTARTLVIRPEHACTVDQANKRAQWEATVRASRGDSVSVDVQGWTQADGTLWPINALVDVQAPSLAVKGRVLITATDFSLDDSGEVTRLTLRDPRSFLPEPKIRQGGGANYWKEIVKGV